MAVTRGCVQYSVASILSTLIEEVFHHDARHKAIHQWGDA